MSENNTEIGHWSTIEAVADYFDLAYSTVRDECQQYGDVWVIDDVLVLERERLIYWVTQRYGADSAERAVAEIPSVSVPKSEVDECSEWDSETIRAEDLEVR